MDLQSLHTSLAKSDRGVGFYFERVIEALLLLAAVSTVLITVGILVILLKDARGFFTDNYNVSVVQVPTEKRPAVIEVIKKARNISEERAVELLAGQLIYGNLPENEAARLRTELVAAGAVVDVQQHYLIGEFLTSREWGPQYRPAKFGILPLLSGTITTTVVALLVAIPIGTIIAIWLSEYCPARLRETIKPTLELLAAVPTVVYGYFALLVVTPIIQWVFPSIGGFNMLSAGLVMGVMIIPYVSSLSEDAMRAVPMQMREGSYAMGATKMQTAFRVIFPSALSGVTAAYILGIARAVGETMVVAIAAGQQYNFSFNPGSEGATITAYIVQVSKGDLPANSREFYSIYAAGLTLLLITLAFNIVGFWLRKRYRQAY